MPRQHLSERESGTTPTTFSAMSEAEIKRIDAGGGSANSNGVNCLAVNNTYLFYLTATTCCRLHHQQWSDTSIHHGSEFFKQSV